MIRRIIEIDEEKCTGCRLCAEACHEGAIEMVDGKARLVRDDYCDGFGDCLPACPVAAISFIEREAAAYDEAAVLVAKQARETGQVRQTRESEQTQEIRETRRVQEAGQAQEPSRVRQTEAQSISLTGCPGSALWELRPESEGVLEGNTQAENTSISCAPTSELGNWPIQIKLTPTSAPCFDDADLLIAADCTAFSYGNFHADFMRGRAVLIGCPKLDALDYSEKLSAIFASNKIKSVSVARMEVPCCGGLERAARLTLEMSDSKVPLRVITIGIDGTIREDVSA